MAASRRAGVRNKGARVRFLQTSVGFISVETSTLAIVEEEARPGVTLGLCRDVTIAPCRPRVSYCLSLPALWSGSLSGMGSRPAYHNAAGRVLAPPAQLAMIGTAGVASYTGLRNRTTENPALNSVVREEVAEAEQTVIEPVRREDDDVVRRVLEGETDAFEHLVRRYSPRVFSIIGSFFHHRDTVEDIAQEVFVKSFSSLASYTLGRSFEAWLARITVNCCYDHLRAIRKRGEQVLPQADETEGDWMDLQMVETAINKHVSAERQREASDIASRLLSKLPPEDRLVLVLMDGDGYSVRDIAEMTGWGPSKVKVRAFRARRTLRTAMKRLLASSERKRRSGKNE